MTRFLFISYLNRSGSTFLMNQLSRIPDFCVCPEADILYELFLRKPFQVPNNLQLARSFKALENDKKFACWKLKSKEITSEVLYEKNGVSLFFEILEHFRNTHFPNATIIVFKNNFLLELTRSKKLFADRKVYQLAITRDPRAIYCSQKTTLAPPSGKPMCRNPLLFVIQYRSFSQCMAMLREDKNFLELGYESLIEKLEPTVDALLKWLDATFKFSEFKNFPPLHNKWLTDEYRNIHRLIDQQPEASSLHKWKNILSVPELLIIQKFCSSQIENKNKMKTDWKFKLLIPFLLLVYLPDMLFKTSIDWARNVKFRIYLRWKK